MEFYNLNPATMFSFFLTLFRVSIILFLLPFFGGDTIPRSVKAALCLVLALALWPALSFPGDMFPAHPLGLIIMILGELVLGLVLGLLVRFIFAAIQTGGQIVGFQMGFAMVNVVDPITGVSEAVTAHFLYMTSLLTFLTLNGHLLLLYSLKHSFALVPPGGLFISSQLSDTVLHFSAEMFVLALKIAAPVMAAIFLVDLALALVGRAAPQMNVMMLGFPLKISVGFFFLGMLFTIMSMYIQGYVGRLGPLFKNVLEMAH